MAQIRIRSMLNCIKLTQTIQPEPVKKQQQNFYQQALSFSVPHQNQDKQKRDQNYLMNNYRSYIHNSFDMVIDDSFNHDMSANIQNKSKEVGYQEQVEKKKRKSNIKNPCFLTPSKVKIDYDNFQQLGIGKKSLTSRGHKQNGKNGSKTISEDKFSMTMRIPRSKMVADSSKLTIDASSINIFADQTKQKHAASKSLVNTLTPRIRSSNRKHQFHIKSSRKIQSNKLKKQTDDEKRTKPSQNDVLSPWDSLGDSTRTWKPSQN